MDLTIPQEMRMVQGTIRKLVETEIIPHEREYHDGYELPDEIRLPLREKVWNLGVPAEQGGGGLLERPAFGEVLPGCAGGADY